MCEAVLEYYYADLKLRAIASIITSSLKLELFLGKPSELVPKSFKTKRTYVATRDLLLPSAQLQVLGINDSLRQGEIIT